MRTLVVQSAADKTSSRNQAQPCAMMQRVVPLFETLDDLDNAGATLQRLLDTPWYRKQLRCTCCSLYSIEVARTRHPDEAFLQLGIPFLHSTQLVSLLGNLDALSYTKPICHTLDLLWSQKQLRVFPAYLAQQRYCSKQASAN